MSRKNIPSGRQPYSLAEIYRIAVYAFRSIGTLKRASASGLLPADFRERLMLAVTAVNQCSMCSYAHTGMALKAGLSREEIDLLVSGEFPDLPAAEQKAVLFAQHYADSRGRPSAGAWKEILSSYGPKRARAILAALRVIMLGNSVGIALSSLHSRMTGKGSDHRTSLAYELSVVFSLVFLLPAALVHALLSELLQAPVIRF